jgi:hypothetical protein
MASRGSGVFAGRPAGLRVLIPGYPQWCWRQSERAAVLFGTFASALGVGLFGWGTATGWAMLALAFAAHAASAADVIRQGAFPGFGRWVPTVTATAGLGLGCYVPALAMGAVLAWPSVRRDAPQEQYLVNRWAYRNGSEPQAGDWVWYARPRGLGFGIGRLVAGPGAAVEWSGARLAVGGQPLGWLPRTAGQAPEDLVLTVPDGCLLVAPLDPAPGEATSCGLVLVDRDHVVGRAWAKLYPVWSRRLLL